MRNIATNITASLFLLFISCTNGNDNNSKDATETGKAKPNAKVLTKPPGTYQDTLTVNAAAAVFYYPDSIQLGKIKQVEDTAVYESTMHEYAFQLHYTHVAIKKQWPQLNIIEANHYRYLRFIKKDGAIQYVDLDTLGDSYGLLVFDGKKNSVAVDMTNAETQVSFYLK